MSRFRSAERDSRLLRARKSSWLIQWAFAAWAKAAKIDGKSHRARFMSMLTEGRYRYVFLDAFECGEFPASKELIIQSSGRAAPNVLIR